MGARALLKALTIQDLAVVRHLDLEFQAGLTVFTGETGAGKSIVVDALGLLLGDRADSGLVRPGATRAVLSASFVTGERPRLRALMADHALEQESELLLRRVIGADGRSRAFCNETPITLQVLREIGAELVDIHGQHEHHSLLNRAVQRVLLDEFGALESALTRVTAAHAHWLGHVRALEALRGTEDPAARIAFLRFQIDELEAARPEPAELERLESEHRRAAHTQRLGDGAAEASARLFEGDRAARRQVRLAAGHLRELAQIDPGLQGVVDMCEQASINLEEAERELEHYRSSLAAADPRAVAALEQRLRVLHDLARKHRCEISELPEILARLSLELEGLEGRDTRCAALAGEIAAAEALYAEAAAVLTRGRREAGTRMESAVTELLRQLGMSHARFEVALEALREPSAHGAEDVEFLVSTNPDMPPRALRKVASGGELSRASLAIQVATASNTQVPTLVYDEIDTGIGGRVANTVARHLKSLGETRQILCVTHLAQVASAGHQHVSLVKEVADGVTETRATALQGASRVEEIARMLGGEEGSSRARAHAKELLGS